MDILFLLIPVSILLALAVMAVLGWAVWAGQFEDIEVEGRRILDDQAVVDESSMANSGGCTAGLTAVSGPIAPTPRVFVPIDNSSLT